MGNLGFLFAAFAVAWLLVFGYVLSVARRTKEVEGRLERLEREGSTD